MGASIGTLEEYLVNDENEGVARIKSMYRKGDISKWEYSTSLIGLGWAEGVMGKNGHQKHLDRYSFIQLSIITLLLLGFFSSSIISLISESKEPVNLDILAYTPHGAIDIDGNTDFAATASSEGWSGSGTDVNPYVIEWYDITTSSGVNAIIIVNTDVHFIIRNCYLHDLSFSHAIKLFSVRNATIFNNTCSKTTLADGSGLIEIDSSSNVSVDKCISNNGEKGIFVTNSNGITLSNNTCTSNSAHGICLTYSYNNALINNNCSNNQRGIYLVSSNGNTISNNTCNLDSWYGIQLSSSSNNNALRNNICSDDGQGICLESCSSNIISNNNCSSGNGIGIYLGLGSNSNILANNTCNWNSGTNYGIYLTGSGGNTINNNTCLNNSYGIRLFSSIDNTISNNTCSGNWDGISLDFSSSSALNNNTCSSNAYDGICLSSSSSNTLDNNACTNNPFCGFDLWDSNSNILSNNTCNSNAYGIYVAHSDSNVVQNNTCNANSNDGIFLNSEVTNIIVEGNTCNLNIIRGINVASSAARILNNTCSLNIVHGIVVTANNVIINNNSCDRNSYGGIYVDVSVTSCQITNNSCTLNVYGIFLSDNSNGNLISNNSIHDSTCNLFDSGGVALRISYNNQIKNNIIASSQGFGIHINGGSGNYIWNNSLIGNNGVSNIYDPSHIQAYDSGTSDQWYISGSPHGFGNYWSDWTTPDADQNGIVDIDYLIAGSGGARDLYPLANPTNVPVISSILIDGNSDFSSKASLYGWQGNGLNSNPFVIEGYSIQIYGDQSAILIRNTTVHFIIRDCHLSGGVKEYVNLMRIENATNGTIRENIFENSIGIGIGLYSSNYVLITNNTFTDLGGGIYLQSSDSNTISNNSCFTNSDYGFLLNGTMNNIVTNNSLSNDVIGISLNDSLSIIMTSNKIENCSVSGIHMNCSDGASMNQNIIGNNSYGIRVSNTTNLSAHHNYLFGDSIYIEGSSILQFTSHNITSDNLVNGCNVTFCKNSTGLSLANETLGQLIIVNCTNIQVMRIKIESADIGFFMKYVDGGTIGRNVISYCSHFGFLALSSINVTIVGNNVTNCDQYGIFIKDTSQMMLYDNNFIDNSVQAADLNGTTNSWDNGYPSGGNYWSDYIGNDFKSGVDQNIPGNDSIGDTPYIIDSNSIDHYPLMNLNFNTFPVPSFTISPTIGNITTLFFFNASGSYDLENGKLQFRWDWNNDHFWDTDWNTSETANHNYSEPGIYSVALEVRDIGGLTRATTQTLIVANTPPHVYFTIDPPNGDSNTIFTFNASLSYDKEDGTNLMYRWAWDWQGTDIWDTPASSQSIIVHHYTTPGIHSVRLQVIDTDGGTNTTINILRTNNTPPIARFNTLPIIGRTTTSFNFDASSSSDIEPPLSLQFRWDWTNDSIFDTNWTSIPTVFHSYPSQGTYTVRLEVKDGGELTDNTTHQIIVDDAAPIITITMPMPNPYFTSSSTVALIGTTSDNIGVTMVNWKNMATGCSGTAIGTISWTINGMALNLGSNLIYVNASDAAGNLGSNITTVIRDDVLPTCTITSPAANPYYTTGATVALIGTAFDNVSVITINWKNMATGASGTAIGTISWSVSGIALNAGDNLIYVNATDAAGNIGSNTTMVVRDNTNPTCEIVTPVADQYFTLSGTVALGGTASDTFGIATVTWKNIATGASGSATGTISWSISSVGLNPGSNQIYVNTSDLAGNLGSDMITVIRDNAVPTCSITSPAAKPYFIYAAAITLSGTASDKVGITTVTWKNMATGGSGTATGTANWIISGIALNLGNNLIYVNASDAAGNVGSDMITVTRDNTDPTCTIVTPTSVSTYSTNIPSISVSGSSFDTVGVVTVTWKNMATGGSGTAIDTISWSVSGIALNAGDNLIYVNATDAAGNIGIATLTVKFDGVAPTTIASTIGTTGLNGWYVSSDVTVLLYASDGLSEVESTWYKVDTGTWKEYQYGQKIVVSGEGDHTVYYCSQDSVGNNETSNLISIRIDWTPPTTELIMIPDLNENDWLNLAKVRVNVSVEDNVGGSGVAKIVYILDDGQQVNYLVNPGTLAFTFFEIGGDGIHKIRFYSIDAAGNTEYLRTMTFGLDTVKPIILTDATDIDPPQSIGGVWRFYINLNGISDDLSGIDRILIYIGGEVQPSFNVSTNSPLYITAEKTSQLRIVAVDKAGNKFEVSSLQLVIREKGLMDAIYDLRYDIALPIIVVIMFLISWKLGPWIEKKKKQQKTSESTKNSKPRAEKTKVQRRVKTSPKSPILPPPPET